MTYGAGYNETRNKLHELNETLSNSRTWNEEPQSNIPFFHMVTRRAANLKDILYRRRALTSGLSSTITEPCTKPEENRKGRRCQTCNLISQKSSVTNNQITVSCRGGNCKTKNIVYAATCTLCNKNNVYIGKTITSLSQRVNGHRGQFYKLIGDDIDVNIDNFDDDNVLGAHIIRKHKKTEKSDFDSIFIFDILWIDQPENLRKYEQSFINRLKTLYPFGLNNINSITGKQ